MQNKHRKKEGIWRRWTGGILLMFCLAMVFPVAVCAAEDTAIGQLDEVYVTGFLRMRRSRGFTGRMRERVMRSSLIFLFRRGLIRMW